MKADQLKNLLGFYLNIIYINDLLHTSPNYIEEKWKYWIDTVPTVKSGDKYFSEEDWCEWCDKWRIEND